MDNCFQLSDKPQSLQCNIKKHFEKVLKGNEKIERKKDEAAED